MTTVLEPCHAFHNTLDAVHKTPRYDPDGIRRSKEHAVLSDYAFRLIKWVDQDISALSLPSPRIDPIFLPDNILDWPALWREVYEERVGIMSANGVNDCERKAEASVRSLAERGQ